MARNDVTMEKPISLPKQMKHLKKNFRTNPKIAASHRDTIILRQSDQSDNTGHTVYNCSITNKWNNKNEKCDSQII